VAIRDLLWACPECRRIGGIRTGRDGDRCIGCGTRFRRVRAAVIEAARTDGSREALPAAVWAERLSAIDLDAIVKGAGEAASDFDLRERVRARFAVGETPVRHAGRYMNRIERFGPDQHGTLELADGALVFRRDDGSDVAWPFDRITAIQPSSSTLQIKGKGMPLASFRFPDGSARLWEELLCAALRRHYREAGRGEIVEFQPRIVSRP
jgi:hypothetical protein